VWDFFKNKSSSVLPFKTDLHSHLLPNLDDGVKSFEESAQIIRLFIESGFTKAITTPHVMHDYYRNTRESILKKGAELKRYLAEQNIQFTVEFAAEYYFDENLMILLRESDELLWFGDKYVLFETNTFSEPMMLDDFIFQLKVKGCTPVLAHPERYQYLQSNFERIEDLNSRGVLMQLNALSLIGHYGKPIQKVAAMLIEKKMVHFVGSDCHNLHHAQLLKSVLENKYFHKALELPLLNFSL
jgi:protein-tyrosine phosphatase